MTIDIINNAVPLGAAVAVAVSYTEYKSIPWAVVHGFFGWAYLVYRFLKNWVLK